MSRYVDVSRKCDVDLSFTVDTKGENSVIKDEADAKAVAEQLEKKVKEMYNYQDLEISSKVAQCEFEDEYILYELRFAYYDDVKYYEGSNDIDDWDCAEMCGKDDMACEMAEEVQKAFTSLGYNSDWEVDENRVDGEEEVYERYIDDRETAEAMYGDFCATDKEKR